MTANLRQLPALFREIIRIFAEPVGALVATAFFVSVFCAGAGVLV